MAATIFDSKPLVARMTAELQSEAAIFANNTTVLLAWHR